MLHLVEVRQGKRKSARERFAELDAISRERELTELESAEMWRAFETENARQRRLPRQIMEMERRVRKLRADLWPAHLGRLQFLEERRDRALADIIERELKAK
jgi:hypothetical protein